MVCDGGLWVLAHHRQSLAEEASRFSQETAVAPGLKRIGSPKGGRRRSRNTQLGYGFPPGFGLRQSSAALDARLHTMLRGSIESAIAPLMGKRQKTLIFTGKNPD